MTRKPSLVRLLKGLSHTDASKRRAAAEGLAEGDERAVYPLIKALSDASPGVQDAAMRSLISIGGELTAYMVMPLLREGAYLRNTALLILKETGVTAVPLLYSLLRDRDDDIRKFGIDLLAEIKEGVSAEKIVPLVRDPNSNVRAAAAKALGQLGHRDAVPELIKALNDEEWVCFTVLESLGELKDEASVRPVAELLRSGPQIIRHAAIEALGKIGSPLAADTLSACLPNTAGIEKMSLMKALLQIGITPSLPDSGEALLYMFRNGDWDEKILSLKGLVALKEAAAVRTIIDIAGSLDPTLPESEQRLEIIRHALTGFGCVGDLIDILDDQSVKFRGKVLAIEVIGELKCRQALPRLKSLMALDLRDVRRASIQALGKINDAAVIGVILGAVNDADGHVRKTAAETLGRLKTAEAFGPLLNMLRTEEYPDVAEETVKALLAIDPERFGSLLGGLGDDVKEIAGRFKKGSYGHTAE